MWRRGASRTFPRLRSDTGAGVDVGLWAGYCLSASAERLFVAFLGPVTFHGIGRSYVGS